MASPRSSSVEPDPSATMNPDTHTIRLHRVLRAKPERVYRANPRFRIMAKAALWNRSYMSYKTYCPFC